MKKYSIILTFLTIFLSFSYAQVNNIQLPTSINEDGQDPHPSAILEIQSYDKGILIPRLPFCEIEEINNPAEGLIIYDTEFNCLRIFAANRWDCLSSNTANNFIKHKTTWSNLVDGEGYFTDIKANSNQEVYVAEETEDHEIRLTKFNKNGDISWTHFHDGSNFGPIAFDDQENIYVSGSFKWLNEFTFNNEYYQTQSNNAHAYYLKLDSAGNVLTSKYFPVVTQPSNSSNIKDQHIFVDQNNDIVMAIVFRGTITIDGSTFSSANNIDELV